MAEVWPEKEGEIPTSAPNFKLREGKTMFNAEAAGFTVAK